MSSLVKGIVTFVTGAMMALLLMFGLVWSQTRAPDVNPAAEPVVNYGG